MQILMWKIPMVASATNIVTMMTLVWPFPAEIWVLANSSAHYVICWLIFKATAFSVKFKPERAFLFQNIQDKKIVMYKLLWLN